MPLRQTLRRWHIWLGWLVGLPLLFWTLSGVIMVWKPIEEVRGTDLLAEAPAVRLSTPPVPPRVSGLPVEKLSLEPRAAGPRWVVQLPDGPARLADPLTGRLLPPVGAADAAREVTSRYRGSAQVASVRRTSANDPPLDLRRPVATWAVELSDGARFYVDAGSGEVVARRTRWWRFYDWMWGLHIMDLRTREDSHNPWVIGFGIAALVSTVLALALLPLTTWRRRRSRD
uniref:PepSY domain-containing protein n=1 Tax=uncultured Sphingomonas sp. TaxID=158754 RepID=UPI0025ED020C|nr:PepSY domain-containing protein [uncultured Sphingomonas sp.]